MPIQDNSFLFPKNLSPINWNKETTFDNGNVKDKVALVADNGIFIELAIRLAKDFKKVYYYTDWKEEFPVLEQVAIGFGVQNIINVKDIFEPDDVDIYIFPNTGNPYIQKKLINDGKIVWGTRMAEDLELNRFYGAKQLQKAGLPVPNIKNIQGIDNLITYLTPLQDKWIKVSYYRGQGETWHFTNIKECAGYLENVKCKLGPFGEVFEWLVFDPIEAVTETGADGIVIDGQPANYIQYGYEVKDLCYCAEWIEYAKVPELIKVVHDKINPILGQYGYRNFFSTEIRVTESKIPYMSDFTTRMGAPSFELIIENVENISDVIWNGAQGKLIDLKPKYKYACMANMLSEFGCDNNLAIFFPSTIRDMVKLRNLAVINGTYYYIAQPYAYPEIGSVLGFSNTSMEDAIAQCKANAKQVSAYQLEIRVDALDECLNEIEKGKSIGIDF